MKKALIILLCLCSLAIAQDKPYRVLNSFNAGELSPLLNAREDLSKYQAGLSVMENMIPLPQGAAQKRPGTKYVATSKNNTKICLRSFEFSTEQSYIIELGNQYARFFADKAVVYENIGTQDLSDLSANLTSHWKCDENAASTAVDNDEGTAALDGVASANTSTLTTTDYAGTANEAFDLNDTAYITVSDAAALTFGDGSDDSAFTLHAWVYYSDSGARSDIITKYKNDEREWALYVNASDQVVMELYDESANITTYALTNDTLSDSTWYFVVVTYSGAGGASAASGITIYLDWISVGVTATNNASYVAMEDKSADVLIGAYNDATQVMVPQDEGTAIGDFTGSGGLAAGFDGDNDEAAAVCALKTATGVPNIGYIGKDWGSGNTKIVTGFKAWGSNDIGFINVDNPTVTITLQGSTDNFSSSTVDLGNASDTDANSKLISKLTGLTTTTAYRYHRLKITHDSGNDRAMYLAECEFYDSGSASWGGKVDNVAIFDKALTSSEVVALAAAGTTAYEISTPYLTADLFELKMKQSADVLYLIHPDYEVRKLSRLANAIWSLAAFDTQTGPFRTQNTDEAKTITASATTGSVTLTASGHAPFVSSTTAGHLPSGSAATSKSQTGALFKLVHPLATLEYSDELDDNYTDDQTENVSWLDCGIVYKGATWYLTTLGTWTGTLEIQRNYTIGAAHDASGWETATMKPFASTDDRNVTTDGTEDDGDASYRAILTESGDAAEACKIYFSTNQTEHIGIVEITAVASTTSATATVLTTLASTDATHKWSEGSWSNYRGWPRTVAFFEDRLTFGGNASQPDTIWSSVTSDYDNMLEGPDDDDALSFTLSSRQVNVIEWLVGKDKILIGTSGAEWTLGGSAEEPLTPSNVKAEQHSTYGSADLQATLASESVLFFQRGAEKMRELAYNWETDAYVAPDMTLLVPEITGDGITDVAYQQTPNSILWCVRDDGEMAIFVYERKELITSWSRLITDGDYESVAVITGDPEDEVWVSVNRTIGGNTVRYIEYFAARDFGTDVDDAYFVDSGITYDSTATTTITGLTHLNAETVAVLGDGAVQDSQTVSSGQITITSASTVQAGLPFTVQMKTMPLSWFGSGQTIQGRVKRINEVVARYYNSGDFDIGKDATTKNTLSITDMDTGDDRMTFPAGYDRKGYVFVYQQSPEPLTLVALMIEFMSF